MKEKLKDILNKVYDFVLCISGDNVGVYAAQASFFLIISAIPFMMFILTISKYFIDIDLNYYINSINSFLPKDISQFIINIVNELFDKTSSVSAISITVVSTLWLASKGIMALSMGLNNLYHLPPRNWFYMRFMSIIYTLMLVAALIITIVVFGFGTKIEDFLAIYAPGLAYTIDVLLEGKLVIFFIYLSLLFTLFYKFLPSKRGKFKDLMPGAALAAAGWLIFSYLYSIYIENYSNYTFVYGSLTALVLLMLWLYFCMNIFLYGAQLNKMIKNGYFKK